MDADKDCFTLTGEAWTLGADASAVIAMRLAQIADGGAAAQRETWRMFSEKVIAHSQFGAMIARGDAGFTPCSFAASMIDHYGPWIRANRRRLSRRNS